MMFKAGCFFVMLVVGSIAFPLNEEEDMSFFFDNSVDPHIIGGVAAEPVAYMVALTTGITAKVYLCGGSIINQRFVLTAAHCIRGVLNGNSLASSLLGNLGSNRWSSSSIEHRFSRAINHPNYQHNIIKNDIGFLVTASAIAFADNVQPISLNFDFIRDGIQAVVNGWGFNVNGGPFSQNLMELHPFIINGEICVKEVARAAAELNRALPPVDPELEICTYFLSNTGMCHGDSGSALVLKENKQQIGVVSWGVPCAQGVPDMFARVSAYKSWIEETIQQAL